MWKIKDKYNGCCENSGCEGFDNCTECWDEWAERNPPMTNADRIRAMTDEELAKILYYGFDYRYCSNDPACFALLDTEGGVPEEKCIGCALRWLKQPWEGDYGEG